MSSKIDQILKLVSLIDDSSQGSTPCSVSGAWPFSTGKKVFIRTVTHYLVGEVICFDTTFVQLTKATWVADSKRWFDCLSKGFSDQAELEPEPNGVHVAIGSIVDVREWKHDLPTKQQ